MGQLPEAISLAGAWHQRLARRRRPPQPSVPEICARRSAGASGRRRDRPPPAGRMPAPDRANGGSGYGSPRSCGSRAGCSCAKAGAKRPRHSFATSIECARAQQARSWELRSSTTLAELLIERGDRAAARELLQPIYDWFKAKASTPTTSKRPARCWTTCADPRPAQTTSIVISARR